MDNPVQTFTPECPDQPFAQCICLLAPNGCFHYFEPQARPYPAEAHPQKSIDGVEPGTAGTQAAQDCELVAQRNDLELQFHAAAKPASESEEKR
jgi:hypothetical protein